MKWLDPHLAPVRLRHTALHHPPEPLRSLSDFNQKIVRREFLPFLSARVSRAIVIHRHTNRSNAQFPFLELHIDHRIARENRRVDGEAALVPHAPGIN